MSSQKEEFKKIIPLIVFKKFVKSKKYLFEENNFLCNNRSNMNCAQPLFRKKFTLL